MVAGLHGFPRPLALIAGGRGRSYAPLRAVLEQSHTRCVVVLGEAAPLIAAALQGSAFPSLLPVDGLRSSQSGGALPAGDAVVLSPACSSFDMFRDYAHPRRRVYRRGPWPCRGKSGGSTARGTHSRGTGQPVRRAPAARRMRTRSPRTLFRDWQSAARSSSDRAFFPRAR